jgi:hypothetical protein
MLVKYRKYYIVDKVADAVTVLSNSYQPNA